jgi:hypothetical protein
MAEQQPAQVNQPLPPPSRPEVGWKGALRAAEVIRHRWQRDWTKHTTRSLQTRERWRRLRIIVALGGTAVLLGLLLFYLYFFPVRVPMLTLVVTDYSWPLPPNAWAQEDLASLQVLDQRGTQTLRLIDGSASWRTQQRGLQHLDDQLQQLAPSAARAGIMVLFVSMHGAVNDLEEPCLLTRESLPHDSNTWLPLRTVLDKISSPSLLPPSVKKLIILDCHRQPTNWHLGQLYNSFPERLADLMERGDYPNVTVLNSCGPGESSGVSAELQGSVFAHFLQLGLAGAADRSAEGGNRDGRVSLHELVHYLRHHVSEWTEHFHAVPQKPMILPAQSEDFDVAWRLNPRVLDALVAQAGDLVSPEPNLSVRERNELWRRQDEFWLGQPYRFNPLGWRDFEHRLIWLEQLAESGPGYASLSMRVAQDLQRRSQDVAVRFRDARRQPTLPNYVRAFTEGPLHFPRESTVHSLSMASFLGSVDAATLRNAQASWRGLNDDVSDNRRRATWEQLRRDDLPQPLAEGQFLTLMERYQLVPLWEATAIPQRALRLQHAARKLDAPPNRNGILGDERAHYWVQADLELADARRREAEDRFLSGVNPDDPLLEELFTTVGYERAERDLDSIAEGMARRDEAWARVVYWAQWLTRPQRFADDQDSANQQINDHLLPLIEVLRELDEVLERRTPDWQLADGRGEGRGDEATPRWSSSHLLEILGRRLESMKSYCDQETRRLLQARADDTRVGRDIEEWLSLPLCTWDQRGALAEKRQQILDERRRSFQPAAAGPARSSDRRSASSRRGNEAPSAQDEGEVGDLHPRRMATAWNAHPVVLALQLVESASRAGADEHQEGNGSGPGARLRHERPLEYAEELGVKVRRRLRMLARHEYIYGLSERVTREVVREDSPEDAREETREETREKTPIEDGESLSGSDWEVSWQACCRAAARIRAAAPLHFPAPSDDPVHRLRRRDLQQLLIWNARRALNDSWGSAGSTTVPFFATVAESYLQGAERVIPPSPEVRHQLDQLIGSLRARRLAVEQALTVTASDILLVDEASDTETRMHVRLGPTSHLTPTLFPSGELISFLSDEQGRFPETTRVTATREIASSAGEEVASFDFRLPGATLVDRGPRLEAIATFRGNEYRAPLLLRLVGGRLVQVELPAESASRVTLQGPRRVRASIQFILDCSQSMSEPEWVEVPGTSAGQEKPRIDVAREALESLLRQLATEEDHRVGVRFFGHRVGWSVVESGRLLRQTRYVHEIPEGLQPYEDVELVLPLGRFDESALGRVLRPLRSIRPWGETPLYLSMIEAVEDFSRDGLEGKQTLVVITDGLNYQFNPPLEKAKSATDVLNSLANQDVTIFIVGFGIPPEEQARAQAEFSMIAEATGGEYLPATNASLFLRSLQSLLRPSQFELFHDEGDFVGSADVNESLEVQPTPPVPQRYHVTYEGLSASLDLRGGERVQLQVSPDGSSLESSRVGSPRFPQQEFSTATHERTGVRAFAHRPVREEHGVRFTISLQRDDSRYFSRPAEVWGEIRPIFPAGTSPSESADAAYFFFDSVFDEDQPVPVVHWFAEQWPAEAPRAEIRIWCRPDHAADVEDTVPLLTVANQVPEQGTGFTRSAVPRLSFQARVISSAESGDRHRVVVVERHADRDSEVGDWRIDLQPSPRRIERRMDPEQKVALHTFLLEGVSREQLSNYQLRFLSKSRFTRDAWYLPEPILVEIADRSDFLPLDRSTSTLPAR